MRETQAREILLKLDMNEEEMRQQRGKSQGGFSNIIP